jgi:hypothetical protein
MMSIARGGRPALASIIKVGDSTKRWIDDTVAEGTSGDPCDGTGRSDQARKPSRRNKSKQAFERACGAIKELYPNGVPGQDIEPNTNLFRRVGEKLKQSGLPGVSDDTILRAAGRRK